MKKKDVLKLIDEGHPLIRVFYPRVTDYQINKAKVRKNTAESIIHSGYVSLGDMDFSGITKHYYFKTKQK